MGDSHLNEEYCAYVVRRFDTQRLYIGSTSDLVRRLREHRNRWKTSVELLHKEKFDSQYQARRKEVYWKSGNGRRALKIFLAK